MAGRGDISEASEALRQPQGVLQFRSDQWQVAKEPMQPADDPIFSVNADKVGGIGPGISFAKKMQSLTQDHSDIGLLLCAKGGSGITAWGLEGDLYKETIKRTHQAQRTSHLKGIFIYVGEGDTSSYEAADNWVESFYLLVNGLRYELGNSLPIIFAQLATVSESRRAARTHGFIAWDYLKNLQASVHMEHIAMVTTEDLPLKEDGLHLNTTAQIALGERFALSMLDIINIQKEFNSR